MSAPPQPADKFLGPAIVSPACAGTPVRRMRTRATQFPSLIAAPSKHSSAWMQRAGCHCAACKQPSHRCAPCGGATSVPAPQTHEQRSCRKVHRPGLVHDAPHAPWQHSACCKEEYTGRSRAPLHRPACLGSVREEGGHCQFGPGLHIGLPRRVALRLPLGQEVCSAHSVSGARAEMHFAQPSGAIDMCRTQASRRPRVLTALQRAEVKP